MVELDYTISRPSTANAELSFKILPSGIAEDLAANSDILSIVAYSSEGETVLPVSLASADGDVLTVELSGGIIPAKVLTGSWYFALRISDGNNDRQTDYIPVNVGEQDMELVIPDQAFKTYLLNIAKADMNSDGMLTLRDSVLFQAATEGRDKSFSMDNLGIETLQGLEYFPNITSLSVENCKATSINLSRNTRIRYFSCSKSSQLTSLILGEGNSLKTIKCNDCPISTVPDFNNCGKLEILNCANNSYGAIALSIPSLKTLYTDILNPDITDCSLKTLYINGYDGQTVDVSEVFSAATIDLTGSSSVDTLVIPAGYANTIIYNEGVAIRYGDDPDSDTGEDYTITTENGKCTFKINAD